MLKEIKTLTYFNPETKIKYSLYYKKDGAEIVKSALDKKHSTQEKKTLPKECLRNLDIFFGSYDFSVLSTETPEFGDKEVIVLEHNGTLYNICSGDSFEDENVFEDIRRYLEVCFDEKLKPVRLSYHSFDGGGPEYTFVSEIKGIFTWYCERVYSKADHETLCGAGYEVVYTLYPLRKGKATALISGSSPIAPVEEERIYVEVDENLSIRVL